jgi:hypothetical protein
MVERTRLDCPNSNQVYPVGNINIANCPARGLVRYDVHVPNGEPLNGTSVISLRMRKPLALARG